MEGERQPDLSPAEREFLVRGLGQWGGPAAATTAVAQVVGFSNVADFEMALKRWIEALESAEGLSGPDWKGIQIAVEVVFASDRLGAGVEWPTVTGWDDTRSIAVLRDVQRKLIRFG